MGRHRIHTIRFGNVRQHGVIEHKAGRISGLREYKDHQEPEPRGQETQHDTPENSHAHCGGKNNLFKVLCIGDCSKCRPEDRYDQSTDRCSIAPVCKIIHVRYTGALCKRIKINRKNCGYHQGKRRVSNIVEHPLLFQ